MLDAVGSMCLRCGEYTPDFSDDHQILGRWIMLKLSQDFLQFRLS